jgi:hypothetical protein
VTVGRRRLNRWERRKVNVMVGKMRNELFGASDNPAADNRFLGIEYLRLEVWAAAACNLLLIYVAGRNLRLLYPGKAFRQGAGASSEPRKEHPILLSAVTGIMDARLFKCKIM